VGLVKLSKSDDFELMHSAQAQSVRARENMSFLFVGHHCHDITGSEDKCRQGRTQGGFLG